MTRSDKSNACLDNNDADINNRNSVRPGLNNNIENYSTSEVSYKLSVIMMKHILKICYKQISNIFYIRYH